MKVRGLPRVTGCPASRPSATAAWNFPARNPAPARAASTSATMYPALCRLAA